MLKWRYPRLLFIKLQMKKILTVFAVIFCISLAAQEEYFPVFPETDNLIDAFVPDGWKKIRSVAGDLNKDGEDDVAIILEGTDEQAIVRNTEGLGPEWLNLNGRVIVILLKNTNTGNYNLSDYNFYLVPPSNDEDAPCLEDPLAQSEGIAIKKGVLCISFNYWSGCGSYGTSNETYKFRLQDGAFRLIGYDSYDFSRSDGGKNSISINFLTNKKCVISGGNEFYESENKPVTRWIDIKPGEPITLSGMFPPFDFGEL